MHFYKYQGTGNDFIMLDSYHADIKLSTSEIKQLCNRNFGIGADGLIFIKRHPDYDFEMDYYNADGSSATFCGNGARCIVAFAQKLHIIDEETVFIAKDGVHKAEINNNIVKLQMRDVIEYQDKKDFFFVNTGTEHTVIFVDELDKYNVFEKGKKIRYSKEFQPLGTNVNFVEIENNYLKIKTYEKGVEDETLSCGTGIVASALCFSVKNSLDFQSSNPSLKDNFIIDIKAKGGDLKVFFNKKNNIFTDIWLQGETNFVFEGVF